MFRRIICIALLCSHLSYCNDDDQQENKKPPSPLQRLGSAVLSPAQATKEIGSFAFWGAVIMGKALLEEAGDLIKGGKNY